MMFVFASKYSETFSVETSQIKSRNHVHVLSKVPNSLKRKLLIHLIYEWLFQNIGQNNNTCKTSFIALNIAYIL